MSEARFRGDLFGSVSVIPLLAMRHEPSRDRRESAVYRYVPPSPEFMSFLGAVAEARASAFADAVAFGFGFYKVVPPC